MMGTANDAKRTALHRLHDTGGRLLYVGITNNTAARWAGHAFTKP